MRQKALLLIALQIALSQLMPAQSFYVESLTTDDGLSHGYVSSLYQDSRGFVWIGTFYGLNRYDGYQCKSYLPNDLDRWSLHASVITTIAEDNNGMIWLGTDNGIVIFNPYSERFARLHELNPAAPAYVVRDLVIDKNNNVWCYYIAEGANVVYRIQNSSQLSGYLNGDLSSGPDLQTNRQELPSSFGNQIRLFQKINGSTCLLANQTGNFISLDLISGTIHEIASPDPGILGESDNRSVLFDDHDFSNPLQPDERFGLLRSSEGKEYLCQFFEQRVFLLEKSGYHPKSAQVGSLPVIVTLDQPQSAARIIDQSGKIWVGTIGGGVRIIRPILSAFRHIHTGINFCNPAAMPDSRIWSGMYAQDKVVDIQTGLVTRPVWANSLKPGESVNSALYDPPTNKIFLILNSDNQLRLARYDLNSGTISTIETIRYFTTNPVPLYKDSRGNIWVAGSGGEIIIYNVNSGKTDHREVAYLLPEKSNHRFQMFRCITEDRSGRIWIGGDAGLTRVSFNNGQPEFTAYHNKGTNGPIFRSTWIFCLYPDPRDADLLWIGTMSGGLARFNCKTEKVTYVSSEKNPGFDIVSGVVADNKSNLWLSTNKGLYQYQIPTDVFVDYSKISHIPKLDINAGASILTDAGLILLGTTNGMIEVNPRDITSRDVIGNLVISNLAINRQSTDFAIAEGKISFDEKSQISLNLSYDDNYVSVGFSIPTALNPASAQYRYKIEGLGNEWVYIGQTHNIEFSRLSPGRYLLEIQAVSGGQSWSDASSVKLPIHVSPPWYASNLAYILYLCLLTGLIWAGLKYQKNRLALQFKADLNQKEMERLQSMDDFKNRFFAYIAHEFKTPLTIIMGASEQLKRAIPGGNTGQYQEAIIREGNNMLGLINEMIDVTRLQDKSIKPHYDHRDMVEFLKGVTESHRPLTDLNQISLEFGSDSSTLLMDMDPLRTQYILNNLLSNAIQHTPAGGRIRVELQKSGTDKVMIRVVDNGTGISQEDLPNIFEKYFRAEGVTKDQNNFGLGLSFVRELTDLLHGSITVESVPGAETAFILILPARAPMGILVPPSNGRIDFQPNVSEWVSNVKPPVNAPQLLVVDDNPAIQSYLKLVLQPHFRLLIAKNGQEGLDIAIQEIPDLILTDVMMPVMDGIEMTNRLKSHQLTSHIPVVMLSAKNEIADRIKGQEQGADLYMGKPFNDQELILAIHNLNELQKKWKERYATVYTGTSSLEAAPDMPDSFNRVSISNNDAFMQRVLGTFEKNYANEKFDAVEIAALLNISKAQLYRKLSQISEESVMGMLRNYRLEKAVELIEKEPDMSIKEVAFKVGFKEYSHFSASFKKQFNIAPSEWRKFRMKD